MKDMKEIAEYYDVHGERHSIIMNDYEDKMIVINHDSESATFLYDDWNKNFLDDFAKLLVSIDSISCDEGFIDIVIGCFDEMLDGETYMTHEEYGQALGKMADEHSGYILDQFYEQIIEFDLWSARFDIVC